MGGMGEIGLWSGLGSGKRRNREQEQGTVLGFQCDKKKRVLGCTRPTIQIEIEKERSKNTLPLPRTEREPRSRAQNVKNRKWIC